MQLNRVLEQQIAVFGESGSGKTVLLSSFYGAAQEPSYLKKNLFHIIANDMGQGSRLHRNYLGMRDSARAPQLTRFASTSYSFAIKLKAGSNSQTAKAKPFDALRLIWHDYPGDWFEQNVTGPEEGQRRVDTFRSLLRSDVALVLIDGQRILDNAGQEERYLKSVLSNFRNGLLSLKDDLLTDGQPLVEFPRIWLIALSKSDLLPELDVFNFRDLLLSKAGGELDELRDTLGSMVEGSDALSVGEDFVLLSSAKFGSQNIEISQRVGMDLILPAAATLPFERHISWVKTKDLPAKVAANLMNGAGALALVLLNAKTKLPGPFGIVQNLLSVVLTKDAIDAAAKLAEESLKKANSEAMAKRDYLTAALTAFRMDLEKGEEDQILLRSLR